MKTNMTGIEIIDFDNITLDDLSEIRSRFIREEKEQKLHESWDKYISKYYHTVQEDKFILDLLKGKQGETILDPSFGSGYLVNLLLKNNFTKIYTSDIPSNNLIKQKIDNNNLYKNVKYFYSYFQNLKSQTIKKEYDNIIVIGASLSYCQNWEKNNIIKLDEKEILKSIKGLKDVLSKKGTLYIGNAKTYNSAFKDKKTEEIIQFFDNAGNRVMRWKLKFDWEKLEKKWTCEIFDNEQYVIEKFTLNSHLFTNEKLIEYCSNFFNKVVIIEAPEDCPEDIIKCNDPK